MTQSARSERSARALPRKRIAQAFLAGTCSLLIACIFATTGSPSTYEISIYAAVSPMFWILMVATFVSYSFGLIEAARRASHTLIGTGLVGITMVNSILTALPAIRYRTYYTQWDIWFHLSNAARIDSTGHVDLSTNFYPSLHLLWTFISQVTGYTVFSVGIFLGSILTPLIIPSTYVLTSRLFRSRVAGSIAASLAAIPSGIVGTFPNPWYYSTTLFVVMIAAVVLQTERATISRTICGIVLVTAFVISHPLAPVFLILAIVLAATVPKVMATIGGVGSVNSSASVKRWWIRALAYTTVMYVAWISILTLVLRISLTQLLDAISAEGVIKPITYGRFLSVSLLAKVLGATAIVGAYWLLGVIVLRKRGPAFNPPALNLVLSLTFVGILLTVVFQIIAGGEFLGTFIERPIYIIALFTPPVASVFISAISKIWTSDRSGWIATVAAITIPLVVALPAMFPSPYVALFNYQNTQQLYDSTNWAAKFIPNNAEVLSNSYVGRYAYYPLKAGEQNYGKLYHLQNTIPSNFSRFLSSSAQGGYLILDKETIEVASLDLRAWRAPSGQDVAMINSAGTILRIYDSGDMQIYHALG